MAAKKIGLVLSGGGARGFAHIGVLKVLDELGFTPDIITGTSAGSIVGGALAAGMSVDEIIEMGRRVTYLKMMTPALSHRGVFSNAPMGRFIKEHYPVSRIEHLSIPFGAVVYDPNAQKEVVLKGSGDLAFAIRASCALPGIFVPPKNTEGHTYVDGGAISPLPVKAIKEMGADIVIAVDLVACGADFRGPARTGLGFLIRSGLSVLRSAGRHQSLEADVIIEPQIAHLRPDKIAHREELYELGEAAAREKIDEIMAAIS